MASVKGRPVETCPVCKTSTFLDRRMTFLVNPECYHKMCNSCVDRIFSHGPAPCPVAGCRKTLRKNRFKVPRFEDLSIERDVDIRARVEKILNRREDEFDSLRDYNNYEERKEDIIQNLVQGIDVAATEAQLQAYANENAEDIAANAAAADREREALQADEQARRDRAAQHRIDAAAEAEADRVERARERRDVVDRIAHAAPGQDVAAVARKAEAEATAERARRAKKFQASVPNAAITTSHASSISSIRPSTTRARATGTVAAAQSALSTAGTGDPGTGTLVIAGLKQRPAAGSRTTATGVAAYDAFGGILPQFRYYTLQPHYWHPWSEKVDTLSDHAAGGYSSFDYQARAQFEAHAGLGVLIAQQKVAA